MTLAINEGLTGTSATKDDLSQTETVLRADIQATEKTLRGEIASTADALRAEIQASEKTLRAEIASSADNVKTELRKEINDSHISVIRWVIGVGISQTAIILAVIALIKF